MRNAGIHEIYTGTSRPLQSRLVHSPCCESATACKATRMKLQESRLGPRLSSCLAAPTRLHGGSCPISRTSQCIDLAANKSQSQTWISMAIYGWRRLSPHLTSTTLENSPNLWNRGIANLYPSVSETSKACCIPGNELANERRGTAGSTWTQGLFRDCTSFPELEQ